MCILYTSKYTVIHVRGCGTDRNRIVLKNAIKGFNVNYLIDSELDTRKSLINTYLIKNTDRKTVIIVVIINVGIRLCIMLNINLISYKNKYHYKIYLKYLNHLIL
jgi:hypothetical protein